MGAGEDGGHGEVDGLGEASFPDGEVGDLAVGAHVMCGYGRRVARCTLRSLRGPRGVRGRRRFCRASFCGFRRSCLSSSGGCGSRCALASLMMWAACSSVSCTAGV